MNKSPVLRATMLFSAIAAAVATQACSSGESIGSSMVMGSGSGATSGTGGSSSSRGTGGTNVVVIITSTGGSSVQTSSGGASVSTGGGTGGSAVVVGGSTGGSPVITGSGSGGAPVVGAGALMAMNGYVMSGPWQGYASTFTSGATTPPSTISPMCDPAGTLPCFKASGTTVCAMGTVALDSTTNSVAGLGFNVNQVISTTAASPAINSIATTGTGLSLTISGFKMGMRAQIVGPTKTYCAYLAADASMIPWSMFNTACYTPTAAGAFVAGSPIVSVGVIVPSVPTASVPFNVCLLDAKPY